MSLRRGPSRLSHTPRRVGLPAAVAVALVAVAACSGGDDGTSAAPTLLTVTPTTAAPSTVATTPASADPATTAPATDAATTGATTVPATPATTAPPQTPGTTAAPGGDATGAPTDPPGSGQPSAPGSEVPADTAESTTTIVDDVEPPNPTVASTAPVPTVEMPPSTIGGTDDDYLLGATSLAGLQFGASQETVLQRLRALLGDPLTVLTVGECPAGDAIALQWFALGVILTDQGFAFYTVGVSTDMYAEAGLPVPGWHTAAGLAVGSTLAEVNGAYPGQVDVEESGSDASFELTGGTDAGISGQVFNGEVQSLSAGSPEC